MEVFNYLELFAPPIVVVFVPLAVNIQGTTKVQNSPHLCHLTLWSEYFSMGVQIARLKLLATTACYPFFIIHWPEGLIYLCLFPVSDLFVTQESNSWNKCIIITFWLGEWLGPAKLFPCCIPDLFFKLFDFTQVFWLQEIFCALLPLINNLPHHRLLYLAPHGHHLSNHPLLSMQLLNSCFPGIPCPHRLVVPGEVLTVVRGLQLEVSWNIAEDRQED